MKTDYRLIHSYQQGLAGFGVVAMDLQRGTKNTTRRWDYFDRLHGERGRTRLDLLPGWMNKGGAMYRATKEIWILDCDDPETIEFTLAWLDRQGLECPMLRTPSGGGHFVFRHPAGLDFGQMKGHVCGPGGKKWDFKLTDRTALVMPGTVTSKGIYLPQCPWVSPPIVDPRDMEPSILIFKDATDFHEYPGSKPQRRWAAKNYLRSLWTKPAIAGEGGKKVLAEVTCNLTRHYCQGVYEALAMLLREDADGMNWNQRCKTLEGSPYPWSEWELFEALQDSLDQVPSVGRALWKAKGRERLAREDLAGFVEQLERKPESDGFTWQSAPWVHTQSLWWRFLDSHGLGDDQPISLNQFSTYLAQTGLQIGRKNGRSAVFGIFPP